MWIQVPTESRRGVVTPGAAGYGCWKLKHLKEQEALDLEPSFQLSKAMFLKEHFLFGLVWFGILF